MAVSQKVSAAVNQNHQEASTLFRRFTYSVKQTFKASISFSSAVSSICVLGLRPQGLVQITLATHDVMLEQSMD